MILQPGQRRALEQLRAIAERSQGGVQLDETTLDISSPTLQVGVSIDCSAIPRANAGIRLRGRERVVISIGEGFPYDMPSVTASHNRWAGTPHVQWGRAMCLYQAVSDWDVQAGMYGFMDRLWLWLQRAAAGELDPADAPLHPPAVLAIFGTPIIVRHDTPVITDEPWVGFAQLDVRSDNRIDLIAWYDLQWPHWMDTASAVAVLLPEPFRWEYPATVPALLVALAKQGLGPDLLRRLLWLGAAGRAAGEPVHFALGTPMRRGPDGSVRQHLAVWEIPAAFADPLRRLSNAGGDTEDAKRIRKAAFADVEEAPLRWCPISEDRPEIVVRRDDQSPVPAAFGGKSVAVFGCGAIGGHVAEWIARAGAKKIELYDKDTVTIGILVRQPFTDADIGNNKTDVLADRLKAIRPDIEVTATNGNLIDGKLAQPDWHGSCDIVIDATASSAVRLRLEAARREHPAPHTTLCGLLLGHDAQRAIAVTAPPGYSGAVEDVLRQARLECCLRDELSAFAEEFWPHERKPAFQPEPGCSDPTFRGACGEVVALSASMLHAIATDITAGHESHASARLLALPAAEHTGQRSAHLTWPAATVFTDGVGDYEIRLSAGALTEVRAWMAHNNRTGDRDRETGGVLHGRRDDATAIVWIDTASGPPPDSILSAETFICGLEGVHALSKERAERSRGELGYLGMWHTHPGMTAHPSLKDLSSMLGLLYDDTMREATMLIVGGRLGDEELAGYVFETAELQNPDGKVLLRVSPDPVQAPPVVADAPRDIGLALSGGGARALAFHLGCLRALHDRDLLKRIRVVAGVSGGALMTGLYGYGPADFDEFDARVVEILRRGTQLQIVQRALLSQRLPQDLVTRVVAGVPSAAAAVASKLLGRRVGAPGRRWISRTDGFVDVLRILLGEVSLDTPRRDDGLDIVINACDLRSGTAFRFGSQLTSSSRWGRLVDTPDLATAIAASAAYPLLLPTLDRSWTFEDRDGHRTKQRVLLTDGGVYDNSGTSCLLPGRSPQHTEVIYDVDYVIACDAGRGRLGEKYPFHLVPRISRSFEASFRKLQDASRSALHDHNTHAELKGFVMSYLGQQDHRLPWAPTDLVPRSAVADYPTNFRAMSDDALLALTTRGEQLTRVLIERWCPELSG